MNNYYMSSTNAALKVTNPWHLTQTNSIDSMHIIISVKETNKLWQDILESSENKF